MHSFVATTLLGVCALLSACHYDVGSGTNAPDASADGGHGDGGDSPSGGGSSGIAGGVMGGRGGASGGTSGRGGTAGGGATMGTGAAGGTGSGGTAPVETATVVATSPVPGAARVDTRAAVVLTLDRDAVSSDAAAVTITSASGAAVPVKVTSEGKVLTLLPSAPLDMQSTYHVRVANPLAASPADFAFTTADGVFRPTEDLFYAGEDPSEFSRVIVADAAFRGKMAVMAYRTVNKVLVRRSINDGVTANRPAADTDATAHSAPSWEKEEPIGDAESDHVVVTDTTAELQVGVSDAGDVVVVWNAPVGGTGPYSIYANRYSAASGAWGALPTRLEQDTDKCNPVDGVACGAALPRLAVAANGDALVTWERRTNPGGVPASTVWATALVKGKWAAASLISRADGQRPRAALNSKGQGAVVWVAHDSSSLDTTRLRGFTTSTGAWDTEMSLTLTASTNATKPFVALNDAATLLVGWSEWPSGSTPVPGQGSTRVYWTSPTKSGTPTVGPGGHVNDGFEIALSESSATIGSWGAPNPNSVSGVAFQLARSDLWPSGMTVSKTDNYVASVVPRVDDVGRGLVSWDLVTDKSAWGIYSVRCDPKATTQFAAPVQLATGEIVGPLVGLDASGRGVVGWVVAGNGALQAAFFD